MCRVLDYSPNSPNCHEFVPFASRDAAEQTAITLSACGACSMRDGVQLVETFERVVIEPVEQDRDDQPEEG